MLKEIVDETSRGKYDFMYLRIGMSRSTCTRGERITDLHLQISRIIASQ